jgi:acetyl-CoA synthetase
MSGSRLFSEARDLLLRCREDPARAQREFHWPALGEFDWARDCFDVIASGNQAPALRATTAGAMRR